jgi:hypothetical protein
MKRPTIKGWDSKNPTVYAAGKIWHAPIFRSLRGQFNINSRWIDLDNDHWIVKSRKDILWQQCLEDSTSADIMVIYCEDETEVQRGVLVEAGMALAAGKYVYLINSCVSFKACGTSDVAFTCHENFIKIREGDKLRAETGFRLAVVDWRKRKKMHAKIGPRFREFIRRDQSKQADARKKMQAKVNTPRARFSM